MTYSEYASYSPPSIDVGGVKELNDDLLPSGEHGNMVRTINEGIACSK